MSKWEYDTYADKQSAVLSPFIYFKREIDAEQRRLEREIKDVAKIKGTADVRLTGYAANSDPEDAFVRHAAVIGLLANHGVLDDYYYPDGSRRAHFIDVSETGWDLWLAPTDLKGAFRMFYRAETSDRTDLHVLKYVMPRPDLLVQ